MDTPLRSLVTTVNLSDCNIEAKCTGWWRPRWDVTVTHLPSGIIGHGLRTRTYEEGRDAAVNRIESLLQSRRASS